MNSAETIWSQAKEELKKEMNPASYRVWIQNITRVFLEGGVLTIVANDVTAKNTLKNVYENVITKAVNMYSGEKLTVRFLDPSEVPTNLPGPSSSGFQAPMLNPNYTFDSFVVGDSNQFAHAAALAVAENPARAYNPLFIYGGSGLGKTHLMHAIGHFVYANNNKAKILYVTSEAFTNELIQAVVRENRPEKFRDKYRSVDILMIDDIQFIVGKDGTQEEIFHTFNELYDANKQIVFTSDKPPKEIPGIESRLTSRFECGLIADVKAPNYETRAAILRKKADNEGLMVENDVLYYIAEKVESNIRELEGALNRVMAHAKLMNCPVDIKLAETVLADIIQSAAGRHITPQVIIQATSEYYRLSVDDIVGKKRDKRVALARQMCMYLCRKLLGASFEDIGSAIGGKHYTTVMHACDKIANDIKEQQNVRLAAEDIEFRLKKNG